jgi:hypothetical protein
MLTGAINHYSAKRKGVRMENTQQNEEGKGHDREYKIVVNAREKLVHQDQLTYDDVVALAVNPVPTDPSVLFTIIYTKAHSHPADGKLVKGGSVTIKNGTTFNVTPTSKS